MKKLLEKLFIPQNCEEICTPELKREIFCKNDIQSWVESANKRSYNFLVSFVKATTSMINQYDNQFKVEKQNYVVNRKISCPWPRST